MSSYQHPSMTRLVEHTSSQASGSSTSLVVDHLLYQHSTAQFRLARRELGMDPPQRVDEWVGESELEEEDSMEALLGYGVGRTSIKKGNGRAFDLDARAKPRRPDDDGEDDPTRGGNKHDDHGKQEGIERMLAALLSKLSVHDEDESDDDREEEGRDDGEPVELDSSPSSPSTRTTSPPSPSLGPSQLSLSSTHGSSASSRADSFPSLSLPSSTRLRLLVSGLLDLLLSPTLSPPPLRLPLPSAYNPTLPESLRRINTILAPISASPIPQLTPSGAGPTSSSSVGVVAQSHPLLDHAHLTTSASGQPIKYPQGSIWDQVPRAAGPEGPWAFAGGQVQSSSRPGGFGGSSASVNPPSMPAFPSSVEGPRTRKAVGRAKVLFDAGIMTATPVSFHQPRTQPPQAGPSSPPSSNATRFDLAAGLEPAARKWWDVDTGEGPGSVGGGAAGEGLGRMMGFLRLFLEASRMVAEGVGRNAIDTAEHRRARSSLKYMFGGPSGAAATWESDSEGSVDGSDEGEASQRRRSTDPVSSSIPTSSATFASSSSHSIPAPTPSYLYTSSLPPSRSPSPTPIPTPARRQPSSQAPVTKTRQQLARPSRAWYALLSALLTQVCIEGFGEFGWKGGEAVELVLGVGKGGVKRKTGRAATTSPSAGLEDAGWGLFGSRAEGGKRRREFEKEMEERCQEFLTVESHTRSLRDHFASLAAKYPIEPVERASIRYLESLSSFVGVPALAQISPLYQPQPDPIPTSRPRTSGSIPISSLLNPHPHPFPTYQQQPPTPPSDPRALLRRRGVDRFFVAPRLVTRAKVVVERGRKRGRAADEAQKGAGAKIARTEEEEEEDGAEAQVPEDWPDSFGVVGRRG